MATTTMKTSADGIALIKRFEGLKDGDKMKPGLQPYLCPAGYWTEGYGHVIRDVYGRMLHGAVNANLAKMYSTIHNQADADKALNADIVPREKELNSLGMKFTQNQFDALMDFIYNLGFSSLQNSALLKDIRVGANEQIIRFQFSRWVNSGGKPVDGLITRRRCEADLFFSK